MPRQSARASGFPTLSRRRNASWRRAPPHEKEHIEANLEAQQSVASTTHALFWLGLVGFIASAGGLLLLLYKNLRMLQQQIIDQKNAANEQATHFQNQLQRMGDANRITRQNGRDQLRAYGSIGRFRAETSGLDCFRFDVFNRGLTPSRGIKVYYELDMPKYPISGLEAELISPADDLVRSTFELNKDETQSIQLAVDAAPTLRRRLLELSPGERRAKMHVNVRYRDVFGRFYEILFDCDLVRAEEGGRLTTATRPRPSTGAASRLFRMRANGMCHPRA